MKTQHSRPKKEAAKLAQGTLYTSLTLQLLMFSHIYFVALCTCVFF